MDIGAFSDESFDAIKWINLTYTYRDNGQNKEEFVSSLVTKLQLYVQQVNSAVEDSSEQFLTNLPKVMKDTQTLQTEAMCLRAKMSEVENEIARVHSETGVCMENLEKLDYLKTKLQIAKQGLQESDGWGRLTSELEDFLERNDITNSFEKLNSLQKSLAAQIGLHGQSERENQVEGFKNRLEALASPLVVQHFSSGDIEQSKKFVEMFSNMDRLIQLTQYYRQVQKNCIERQWIEISDSTENSGSNRFLRDFYDILLEQYQKQSKWCLQVFGDKGVIEPILAQCEILPQLQPTRETAVMNALKRTSDKLSTLLEISNANIYFGNMMKKNIENMKVQPTICQLNMLRDAIFQYFNVFIGQYAYIEQTNLNTNLSNLNLIQPTITESIRSLSTANGKVFQWTEAAVRKCDEITQHCAIASLVNVLNIFFKSYLEKYKKIQNQLSANLSMEQDWNLLQTCISLLQCIGDFYLSLQIFEKKLIDIISDVDEKFNQLNEFDLCYKISGKRELNDFKKLVETVKESKNHSYLSKLEHTDKFGLFNTVFNMINPICNEVHDVTLASVFNPIEKHLKNFKVNNSFNSSSASELPDYSYAPQEYITQVGQYLLTLPQHLEPLLLSPSSQLKTALEICDEKYTRNVPSADILLLLIAEECCALYQEQILQIHSISHSEAKQLATDIEYLGSVLDELGLSMNVYLQHSAALLRAPAENYLSLSAGCDAKLVTIIRQMRQIISQ